MNMTDAQKFQWEQVLFWHEQACDVFEKACHSFEANDMEEHARLLGQHSLVKTRHMKAIADFRKLPP